jgi:DNA-binding PadR family transcriptional regulator
MHPNSQVIIRQQPAAGSTEDDALSWQIVKLSALGLSKGNLSAHVDRLESARYVEVLKSFNGKIPHTEYRLTEAAREALTDYWAALDQIRAGAGR